MQDAKPITPATNSNGAAEAPVPLRTHPPLKRRLLHGLQAGLQRSGLAAAYARGRRGRGAMVLMYHSVAAEPDVRAIDPRNHLPPAVFAKHLAFLKRMRRVISLDQLLDELRRGEDPAAGTVAITFDDGYRDNLTVAAPLLRDADLPATIFLATGYVGRAENQWIDQLYHAFATRSNARLTLPDGRRFDLTAPAEIRSAYLALAAALLPASLAEREELLARVRAELNPAAQAPRLTMSWDDVRALREAFPNISLGLHTRDHLDLTQLSDDACRREIEACRADALTELGAAPPLFSCPYSRSSAAVRTALVESGFAGVFARESAELINCASDRWSLPRVIAPRSLTRLAFITSGAYPALSLKLFGRA